MASYSYDLKIEALRLSDEIGAKCAAEKLKIPYGTLVKWRRSANRPKLDAYSESLKKQESLESLEREVRELRRVNSILLDALKSLSSAQAN